MKFFTSFSYVIYGVTLLLLLLVLLFGKKLQVQNRGFRLVEFGLQPAEFAKFATSLALARYLSGLNINLKKIKNVIIAGAITRYSYGIDFAPKTIQVLLWFILPLFWCFIEKVLVAIF